MLRGRNVLEILSGGVEGPAVRMEDGVLDGCKEDKEELLKEPTPRIGMEFESEEDAFQFYDEYGRIMGFSIRRDYHTKSKKDGLMINRKFVCHKEGQKEKDKRCHTVIQPRRETRTMCGANLYVSFNRDSTKWEVKKFDDAHNHLLHPECACLMSTQSNLCESQGMSIEIADKYVLGRNKLDAKGSSSEECNVIKDKDDGCKEYKEELLKEHTPRIGMEFESEEDAFQFYDEYGRIMGFSIRRDYHTKSKKDGHMTNRKFVCHKEGQKEKDKRCHTVIQRRRETRTMCGANLYISFNRDSTKWEVKKFDDAHNHLLHPECAYSMSTQSNLCESQDTSIEIADKYVLGRNRLDAKGSSSEECNVIKDKDDPKLVIATRFMNLCPRMINLATRSSEYDATYKLVDETIRDLCTKVDNMIIAFSASSSGDHIDMELDVVDPNLQRAKGHARQKSWHERIAKRKKVASRSPPSQGIEKSQDPASVLNSSS
ncbi:hypothetical protein RHGRI_033580 [Rhododendron griersonianum]|uniref:FAR1 domain-containing protein n=1 Tax=Rhododendron griersonianum TaxID=479676 RepID=A0AAV6I0G3_9ERIC|nr:hypothetical protein RHGRI_033580 [Rhododendron griersonianum]